MISQQLIELYKKGDAVGSPYEGKQMFCDPVLDRAPNMRGTDETDTVNCWFGFEQREVVGDPVDWARYFANHYTPKCGWGKTYPDFFQLVKYLDKRGTLTYEKLVEMSMDRNSMGNGCLALVYPMVSYGFSAADITIFTVMTHSHPTALIACELLADLFINRDNSKLVGSTVEYPVKGIGGHADAMSTLKTAWWCAHKETEEEATKECIFIGGDTDSTLALTLLLWGFLKEIK